MTLNKLRQLHSSLNYYGYQLSWQNNNLTVVYQLTLLPQINFQPRLVIRNVTQKKLAQADPDILDKLFFNLGLAEIPSYWKAACPQKIIIHPANANQYLSQKQLAWWHDLLIQGMGEFYFTNQIDFSQNDFVSLETFTQEKLLLKIREKKPNFNPVKKLLKKHGFNRKISLDTNRSTPPPYLVPIGGGKDSALVLGILDSVKENYGCLLLEPHSPAAKQIIQLSQAKQTITCQRTIDPALLELNKTGYLNGHTPFSAYLAFASTLVAYLFNYQTILLANERSANEGNQQFHGMTINHQYSKSYDFETKFRQYADEYLFKEIKNQSGVGEQSSLPKAGKQKQAHCPKAMEQICRPEYLSFLRPLWEIQIAKLFAKYPKYHSIFKSCNVGQQRGVWCEKCPKCLFVFTMLFPFIDLEKLTSQIFSHNLFEDTSLVKTGLELAGFNQQKPLECVGTFAETQAAFYLALQKYQKSRQELPVVLKKVNAFNNHNLKKSSQKILTDWNEQNFLSKKLKKILKNELYA